MRKANVTICHLSSVHPRNDIRIFFKQCRSLVANGFDVTLIIADNKDNEYNQGVKIVDVKRSSGRIIRILKTTNRAFQKAIFIDADLYHLHDPELIPIGLRLKRLGKKVIFDSHEDVPKQLLNKPYLDPITLRALSVMISLFERYACQRFDGIVAATPFIRDKFLRINPSTVDINNFPIIGELDGLIPWEKKRDEVCYFGGISSVRGICEVVHACEILQSPARINLAGCFAECSVESQVKSFPGWARVNELGFLDRTGVREVLGRSMAGIVTFHPLPNHKNSQPNKMFEYMSAGIPVISSNFPLWKEIIEGNKCGICVDPLDPKDIASAIDYIVANPEFSQGRGQNGRQAVLKKYNWSFEEQKLIKFYARILGDYNL